MRRLFAAAFVFFLLTLSLAAQRDNERPPADRDAATPDQQKDQKDKAVAKPEPPAEKPPVVMHHEVHVGGKVLRYTTTTGLMPLTDEEGKIDAHIFFIAYT